MWRPHERPGALHDAGDRSDVQAEGAKEEYIRKGSPPLEMRFLDSNHTITSILQYYKSIYQPPQSPQVFRFPISARAPQITFQTLHQTLKNYVRRPHQIREQLPVLRLG